MQNKSITNKTLHILNRVASKGYIKPEENAVAENYKKIAHAFADFFKVTPVAPKDAVSCMELVNKIGLNTSIFFSLFPKTMMDLYRWAATGDELTRNQGETRLLFFFSRTAPSTVEDKELLLNDILKMPDFSPRKNEISRAVVNVANHYDQNGQLDEDPGHSVLQSLKTILEKAESSRPRFHFGTSSKENFQNCAEIIKKYRPDLYKETWEKAFAPSNRKNCVPPIKEAVDVCPRSVYSIKKCNFSKDWDRE